MLFTELILFSYDRCLINNRVSLSVLYKFFKDALESPATLGNQKNTKEKEDSSLVVQQEKSITKT